MWQKGVLSKHVSAQISRACGVFRPKSDVGRVWMNRKRSVGWQPFVRTMVEVSMMNRAFGRNGSLWRSAALAALLIRPAAAVTLGQVDDFEGGTTLGWTSGGSTITSIAIDAGPGGPGDDALNVQADNRTVVFGGMQWTGNYVAAGVTRITMDVRHSNTFTLQLRIGIANGPFGSQGAGDTYVTTTAVPVPNDGAWHNIAIDVKPSDFIPHVNNTSVTPDAVAALANVSHFRLIHNPDPDFRGAFDSGQFRLDNVRAPVAVTESADFDGDDDVDGADFLAWQRGNGTTTGATVAQGDANGDQAVNGADLTIWKAQFGMTGGTAAASAVPEPAGWIVCGLGGLWLVRRRRAIALLVD
jgi:hypothetical protein